MKWARKGLRLKMTGFVWMKKGWKWKKIEREKDRQLRRDEMENERTIRREERESNSKLELEKFSMMLQTASEFIRALEK